MFMKVTRRFGDEEEITNIFHVLIWAKGGMNASLFRMYIQDIFLSLYSNVSKEYIIENGKVTKGSVFFKTDKGPGFKEDREHI